MSFFASTIQWIKCKINVKLLTMKRRFNNNIMVTTFELSNLSRTRWIIGGY